MQNRIEQSKRVAAEEKQASNAERARRIRERAEQEEEKIQALITTPEHQKLLDFARSDEVRAALKEIWDYLVGNKLVEVSVPSFFGSKIKKIPQPPFKVIIKSKVDESVSVGFEYLLSSPDSKPHKNSFALTIHKTKAVSYYIGENDFPGTTYRFKSIEEFLDFYAKREANLL